MRTIVYPCRVVYHHDERQDWIIVDEFLSSSLDCANDYAVARRPEGYHIEATAINDDEAIMLDTVG